MLFPTAQNAAAPLFATFAIAAISGMENSAILVILKQTIALTAILKETATLANLDTFCYVISVCLVGMEVLNTAMNATIPTILYVMDVKMDTL